MIFISTTEARVDLAAVINQVAFGKDRVLLQRHGKDLVAVVPVEDLRRLEELDELEDRRDLEDARRALSEAGADERVPWSEVKARLGL